MEISYKRFVFKLKVVEYLCAFILLAYGICHYTNDTHGFDKIVEAVVTVAKSGLGK
ncbi:MAG: hypothetical protein JSS76_04635 [Bacteroidetes bacterium]|nr:hypothetical protein [Bacteroidota bacterium]